MAFIRVGRVPLAAGFVLEQLRSRFPEYDFDVFDIKDFVRAHRGIFLWNACLTLKAYGWDILHRRRNAKESFLRTPYLFDQVRQAVRAMVEPDTYAFTFQIQSLFDASVRNVPHFVYSDHTNLANLDFDKFGEDSVYPAAWRRLESEIYSHATGLFVRSGHVERSLIEDYGVEASRVHLVYAGSNARVEPSPRDEARYDKKRILFVGMDWERKGGPELVRAFERVRAQHREATLTIVGDAPALHVPGVRCVGRVDVAAIHAFYQDSTVFCMPTRREPFGIAYVEAMAHGLPVVATRVGALPDMVVDGRNGYLVEPGDVDALADRLALLLANPADCRRQGMNSRALAIERYNWQSVGERMEREIRRALMLTPP